MAVLDNNDQDLMQLWSLITELSEQLSQNRSVSVSLYAQAGNIKVNVHRLVSRWKLNTRDGHRIRLCILRPVSSSVGAYS